MVIQEFLNEFDGLTEERRKQGLEAFFNELLRDPDQYIDFILDILEDAGYLEQDDYFGTEGLDI